MHVALGRGAPDDPLNATDPFGLWVKICNRRLSNKNSPPTWKHNPFRHTYLDVSGAFIGFTAGDNPHMFGLFANGAQDIDELDEGRCSPYCMDDKFDAYVLKAVQEVGIPKYFGAGFFWQRRHVRHQLPAVGTAGVEEGEA
jgi:hypothetical protein